MAKREFNGVDIKVEFNETANRQQISSGDKINTLFGKIRKWLSDLKPIAFSGSYDDLANKPESLPANGGTAETISDVLPISKGGTGKITANDALNALTAGVPYETESYSFKDNDSLLWLHTSANGFIFKTNFIKLWDYIKTKVETLFVKKETVNVLNISSSELKTKFRELIFGKTGTGNFLKAVRNNTASSGVNNAYDTGIAFGCYDTQGWMSMKYGSPEVNVGGGNGNGLVWTEKLAFKKDIDSVNTEITTLKKSVSDGKKLVAGSITDKGVTTAADATFATMVTNIGKIETCLQWKNTSNGTYKFVQNGNRWVANNRGINSSIATSEWEITLPKQMDYEIGYRTATESADKLVITIDGETIVTKSGLMTEENAMVCVNQSAGKHILTATYTKDGSVHSYGDMAYVILPPIGEQAGFYKYQSKSITPSSSAQTVYPDTGYDGLYSVSIAASSGVKKLTYVTGSMSFAYVAGGKKVTTLGKPRIIVVARGSSSLTSNNISGVALYLLDEDDTVLVHQGKQVLTNITDTSFNLYNISSNSAKYTYMYGYRA